MSNERCEPIAQFIRCLVAAACLLIVFADVVLAMQGRPGPPGNKDMKAEQRQMEVRETMLRNVDTGAVIDKRDRKQIEAAIEQVKQDFRQIQIVRNELVRNLLANKPLDFKLISDKAGDINKRADRLKTVLMLSADEKKEKNRKNQVEFNNGEMKGALVQLCNRIAIFIENPVLKNPGLHDVEQSAKAGAELLGIIELSDNIKRSADLINKTAK